MPATVEAEAGSGLPGLGNAHPISVLGPGVISTAPLQTTPTTPISCLLEGKRKNSPGPSLLSLEDTEASSQKSGMSC